MLKSNILPWVLAVVATFSLLPVKAQVPNDECFTAIYISNLNNFCADPTQYSTQNATPSMEMDPFCWPQSSVSNDVWFSFTPTKPAVQVKLFGQSDVIPQGLIQPSLAVYQGPCRELIEVGCASGESGPNDREIILTDLIIGERYFIRIDARQNNTGNFQLCLHAFNPVPDPESDCNQAVLLCDKSSFSVESIVGTGDEDDGLGGTCLSGESASVWYKWTCKESGTLTFTLTPNNDNNPEEDLDFAVFLLPQGLDHCEDKQLIRCMASGETIGAPASQNEPCFGPTGLNLGSDDTVEFPGCDFSDDNFVAAIDMTAGESYALVVNNFSQSGFGFTLDFGGTGTFLGPEPDFDIEAVEAFECDKTILFDDLSASNTDQIVEWNWNFGAGATPVRAFGDETHEVVYESFGEKMAALTVVTSRGCQVTKILDLYVEPCCQDTTTLDVGATAANVACAGEENGSIQAFGMRGSPEYSFSLDSASFQPSPIFTGLAAGEYKVYVQDAKGCTDTTLTEIGEPEPLIADAGPDLTVDLGFSTQIFGDFNPGQSNVGIAWSPQDGLSCTNCLNPMVIAPGTTTYVLTITDPSGCVATDEVTVYVELNRPIYAPNVISLTGEEINSRFKLFAGPAGEIIEDLWIYDRWGGLIYHEQNLSLDREEIMGWDGTFQGEFVNPGVFAWHAKVRFIDQVVIDYSGTVTVVQ